jgi:hypothetical protein
MSPRAKVRRLAATDARVHFGELVDSVAENDEVVEVERADDFVVVFGPTDVAEPVKKAFDAEAWLANLDRIHQQIRAYRKATPDAEITEMPEDIIRELRESR